MFRHVVWVSVLMALLSLALEPAAAAEGPSGASQLWTWSFGELTMGDRLLQQGAVEKAVLRYRAGVVGLEKLLRDFPDWQTDWVLLRLAYGRTRLSDCEWRLEEVAGSADEASLHRRLEREHARMMQLCRDLGYLSGSAGKGGALWQAHQKLEHLRSTCASRDLEKARMQREAAELKRQLSEVRTELEHLHDLRKVLAEVLLERDDLSDKLTDIERKVKQEQGRQGETTGLQAEVRRLRLALQEEMKGRLDRLNSRRQALQAEQRGDGASAARYWHLCGLRGGDPVECWIRSAYWYWQVGERSKSDACVSRLLAGFAAQAPYLGMLGRMRLAMGDREGALGLSGLALRMLSKDASSLVSLGAVFMELGASSLAEGYFRRALEVSPRHGEALMCLASLLSASGQSRKAEARSYYERALASGQPRNLSLDAYFGLVKGHRKD